MFTWESGTCAQRDSGRWCHRWHDSLLLQAVSFYPTLERHAAFEIVKKKKKIHHLAAVWNKQIFKQHFIRKTQVLFGCFFKISKWISYRVETFFESCKSSTILDTFRHRRHLKITGNRWITLIELFVLCVFFSRLVYFFLCQICEGFNLARGFIWESIQFFWFVVWPAMNYNSLITTGVASCWSCGPSHAHVGAPYCLLWAGVFFFFLNPIFRFFIRREFQFEKKKKKTFSVAGRKWRKPRN